MRKHRVSRTRAWLIVLVAALLPGAASAQTLPRALQTVLRRAACEIPRAPQGFGPDREAVIAHVVYRAEVRAIGRANWIILCERGRRRQVLVYADSVRAGSRPLARLQTPWDPAEEGCEGWIGLADTAQVRRGLEEAASDSTQLELTPAERAQPLHAGILVGLCEGDMALRYWTGRRWLTLGAYWELRRAAPSNETLQPTELRRIRLRAGRGSSLRRLGGARIVDLRS